MIARPAAPEYTEVMATRLLAACALVLLTTGSASPAPAFQPELRRYYDLLRNVCLTGVTPQITAAYEQARVAVERAQYGSGREGNFWGVRTPEHFYQDCFQSPGNIK